jgi:hypothetical protein
MQENHFNEECVRTSYKFKETIVQNVCTYEEVRVPWEFDEWFSFVAVIISFLIIYITILKTIIKLEKEK